MEARILEPVLGELYRVSFLSYTFVFSLATSYIPVIGILSFLLWYR